MKNYDDRTYELAESASREIGLANEAWDEWNFPGYLYHSGKVLYTALAGIVHDIKSAVKD